MYNYKKRIIFHVIFKVMNIMQRKFFLSKELIPIIIRTILITMATY